MSDDLARWQQFVDRLADLGTTITTPPFPTTDADHVEGLRHLALQIIQLVVIAEAVLLECCAALLPLQAACLPAVCSGDGLAVAWLPVMIAAPTADYGPDPRDSANSDDH